jgi:phenylalanyl-tRNA synthetase beta chain
MDFLVTSHVCLTNSFAVSIFIVEIVYADGRSYVTPNLSHTEMKVTAEAVNKLIGINIEPNTIVELLQKMQITSKYNPDEDMIITSIPITRSDVLHPVDIIEVLSSKITIT